MKKYAVLPVLLISTMVCADAQKLVKDNLKVGYVSAPAVMESKRGKQVRAELEKKMEAVMSELQEEEQKIVNAQNELKMKQSNNLVSDSALDADQQKLRNMARNFDVKRQEKAEEMKVAEQKANTILVEDTYKAAAELAQSKSLDVVIDKDSGRALYVASNIDYTSDLRVELDKKFDAENKKTALTA